MLKDELNYSSLNAELNLFDKDGNIQFNKDKEAVKAYFLSNVNRKIQFAYSLKEKLDYLTDGEDGGQVYYEKEILDMYDFSFIKKLYQKAYKYKFRFQTYVGALKFYSSYALKSADGSVYLERYEDRVCATALYLAHKEKKEIREQMAMQYMEEIITGRYQPATPTFLNALKKQRGELVSCFLLRIEDDMESIQKAIGNALQLSKRGGGVAFNITNIREKGAPIKGIENASSGPIPVMKLLEDAFSYANQLGARQGAGAVYIDVHHPDLMAVLDTKRENADEKIRIKTLSVGVVIHDIDIKLAAENKDLYQFSPYDIKREYKKDLSELNLTEELYNEIVRNKNVRKTKVNARALLQAIAEVQFESGYPYVMFYDTVNRVNPIDGNINMSNLCSEILQVNTASKFNEDGTYSEVGKDISCNLGSHNIVKVMESPDFEKSVEFAIRALTVVSDFSNIACSPTVEFGNRKSHAIGLGQMNLHGFFGKNEIFYGSPESLEFTNLYFYSVLFYALKASNKIAIERGETFDNFEKSKYATGEFFDKYLGEDKYEPTFDKIKEIFEKSTLKIPTKNDWKVLKESIMKHGIYNQNLQAVPPTGSISYINNSTSSIHPIAAKIEIRKEGKLGRVYYPAPYMTNENLKYYESAYEVGAYKIIDVYAEATKHVDQGLSLTLFFPAEATTRDVTKALLYAWKKGIKTIYYIRLTQAALEGTEVEGCVSCAL